MISYNLNTSTPSQQFSIVQAGHSIGVELRCCFGLQFATISIDGKVIVNNVRCTNNTALIPYPAYIPEGVGNLFFYCKDDNYPSFLTFNTDCLLIYLTPSELKELSKK